MKNNGNTQENVTLEAKYFQTQNQGLELEIISLSCEESNYKKKPKLDNL